MVELLRYGKDLSRHPALARAARSHFAGNDRVTPEEQIEIYREQFWLRHTSSLLEDFPGLSGILGQTDWERLVESYLKAHVPQSYTLRDLGDALPEFVEHATWLPHHRLCADMAQLEWAYIEAFDAPEVTPLTAEKIASIPDEAWETAQMVLDPSLHFLEQTYPVADLRRALRRAEDSGDSVPIPEPAPVCLVVYRHEHRLWDKAIGRTSFRLLRALAGGLPLVEACTLVVQEDPRAESVIGEHLGSWFLHWGKAGFITDVITPT